ncbi:MAG: aminoacyl-tRNA hydrolase [Flavobacteriales bacterium]|nr:MAG: aminoacyl-tRNA hydrolase [Flavobacteriales bacterium]
MNKAQLLKELQFKAIRSGGAGGQHVNKVSSKIEIAFNVCTSNALSALEKERISLKLDKRLTKEKVLMIQCDESRSQHKNKQLAIKRLLEILEMALKVSKKRRPTKPSKSAIEKRLQRKKSLAQKKQSRKKFDLE